jgi:uncharacterized low-complexity protein
MSKQIRKPLSIVLGAAVVASLGTAGIANANAQTDADLFSMEELTSGYLTAGGHEKEGSCGEGKCGDDKDGAEKDGEGSCGEDGEDKGGEGSCGSS